MSPPPEALGRLQALFIVGVRLARSAPSGRIALAQLAASLDPAWLPSPAADEFAALLADAHENSLQPLPARDVERVLRDAWGAKPGDELDDFDPEPAAITPGSQVHRGVMDGQAVAIKVLRPGLAASVRQDLSVLEALAAPLGAAFPALQTSAVLAEVRERVLDELDLETEAATQRRFARALRRHPYLHVPAPVTALCHESVLVSEWVDGVPFADASDPDQAAARLIAFVLGAARFGVSYADPHGDNVLITEDGGLAIVDFGACRPIDSERLDAAAGVLEAVAQRDADALGTQLDVLGWMAAEHAGDVLALAHALGGPMFEPGPTRLDSDEAIAARKRMVAHAPEMAALLPRGALAPEDLWPGRGVAVLLGTIARLGASGDWVALALDALRNGWDVDTLGT